MMRLGAGVMVVLYTTAQALAAPPSQVFSPPGPNAPSLHATRTNVSPPIPPATPAQKPAPTQAQRIGWDALRRESITQPAGSPAGHAWRWLLGLAVALVLIRWGLPRALHGGSKGQMAQWLARLAPPRSEGTITVLDTRFLGAGAVHLIAVRGRTLLVGSSTQGVNLLMDLTEPLEPVSEFDRVLAQSKPFAPKPSLSDEAVETEQVLREIQHRLRRVRERIAD